MRPIGGKAACAAFARRAQFDCLHNLLTTQSGQHKAMDKGLQLLVQTSHLAGPPKPLQRRRVLGIHSVLHQLPVQRGCTGKGPH